MYNIKKKRILSSSLEQRETRDERQRNEKKKMKKMNEKNLSKNEKQTEREKVGGPREKSVVISSIASYCPFSTVVSKFRFGIRIRTHLTILLLLLLKICGCALLRSIIKFISF